MVIDRLLWGQLAEKTWMASLEFLHGASKVSLNGAKMSKIDSVIRRVANEIYFIFFIIAGDGQLL